MIRTTLSATALTLLLGMAGLGAPVHAAVPVVAAPLTAPLWLENLLDSAGAPANPDAAALQEVLFPHGDLARNPSISIAAAQKLAATLGNSVSPQDVLRMSAVDSGLRLPALTLPATPRPVVPLVLQMYAMTGITATSAQQAKLVASAAKLSPDQARGMGILLEAVDLGMATQRTPTPEMLLATAVMFLDAADQAKPLLVPGVSAPSLTGIGSPGGAAPATSSTCSAVFEDPLYLVRLGSSCNDVVNATARILVYDPAGNDIYYDNAGGAAPLGLLQAGNGANAGTTGETSAGEGLDNLTKNPLFPLRPTNATWLMGRPGNATAIVGNLTNFVTWAEFAAGTTRPFVTVDQTKLRNWVPIALQIDDRGDDIYSSQTQVVQGAGSNGGVGVLLDRAGNDHYVCASICQASGAIGVGVLVDQAGSDNYLANSIAQASGDTGLLLDYAGNDHYQGGLGVQGGTTNLLVPPVIGSRLIDFAGSDTYIGGSLSQGADNQLIDLAGNDAYTSGSNSQGFGFTGELGLLLDGSGDDTYTSAGSLNQGVGYGEGTGMLADLAGNDAYTTRAGQGIVAFGEGASGILFDGAGNDVYHAEFGQGFALGATGREAGVAALVDRAGDDSYTVTTAGQGSNLIGSSAGMLVDGAGDDHYTGSIGSQGASRGAGAGLLYDAQGEDVYLAGDFSQGSGGAGGVGMLVDGTPQHVKEKVGVNAFGIDSKNDLDAEVSTGPAPAHAADQYTAGTDSQGSSGTGGVGILLDAADQDQVAVSNFIAGDRSQGSSRENGVGALINLQGRDAYSAGANSQGSSDSGLAVLLDQSGKDSYSSTGVATSQGYGHFNATQKIVGAGLMVDLDANDSHQSMLNDSCRAKGETGLGIDINKQHAVVSQIVAACAPVVAGLLTGLVGSIASDAISTLNALITPTPYTAPSAPIFYDGFESGATGWTTAGADPLAGEWTLVDAGSQPQVAPNAHSPSHYWYGGLPGGAAYGSNANMVLSSPSIDLTGTTAPEFHAFVGGSSETGFDFLKVVAVEDGNPAHSVQLSEISGSRSENPVAAYQEITGDLSGFVGQSVIIEFHFTSDSTLEDGQGWNVDDVAVVEA